MGVAGRIGQGIATFVVIVRLSSLPWQLRKLGRLVQEVELLIQAGRASWALGPGFGLQEEFAAIVLGGVEVER